MAQLPSRYPISQRRIKLREFSCEILYSRFLELFFFFLFLRDEYCLNTVCMYFRYGSQAESGDPWLTMARPTASTGRFIGFCKATHRTDLSAIKRANGEGRGRTG